MGAAMMLPFSRSTGFGSHCSSPSQNSSPVQRLVRVDSERLKEKENLTCTECSTGSFVTVLWMLIKKTTLIPLVDESFVMWEYE